MQSLKDEAIFVRLTDCLRDRDCANAEFLKVIDILKETFNEHRALQDRNDVIVYLKDNREISISRIAMLFELCAPRVKQIYDKEKSKQG